MFFQRNTLAVALIVAATQVNAFFRINCGIIQTGRVDPIVNPGAVAAHAHTIVGGSSKLSPQLEILDSANRAHRYRCKLDIYQPIQL